MKDDISRFIFISTVVLSLGIVIGIALERRDDRNIAEEQEPDARILYMVEENDSLEYPVCSLGTFKSWMDYRSITVPSSDQYKLQSMATTNQATGIREYKDHLMVAMAAPYGPVGSTYEITFESNQKIKVIIGDIKADTDCEHSDGSMIEFIVDKNMIGNIATTGDFNQLFSGKIISIKE